MSSHGDFPPDDPETPDKVPSPNEPPKGRFTEDDPRTNGPAPSAADAEPSNSLRATSPNGSIVSQRLAAGPDSLTTTADDRQSDAGILLDEPKRPTRGAKARRVAWELVQTLVLAALIFLLVRGVAQNFRVEGPSMEPGLHNGQYLLVNKAVYFQLDRNELGKYIPFVDGGDDSSSYLFHGPQRGDVIVFRYPKDPDRDFIKRVIGVPGDTVEIQDGVVFVNDVRLDEGYTNPASSSDLEPTLVPVDNYFVLGDNRPNSSDSRSWGFVPEENIIGKAMFSYWPLSDLGGIGNKHIDLGFVSVPLP
jgi:signal peptidase I